MQSQECERLWENGSSSGWWKVIQQEYTVYYLARKTQVVWFYQGKVLHTWLFPVGHSHPGFCPFRLFFFFLIIYVSKCLVCMYINALLSCSAQRGQRGCWILELHGWSLATTWLLGIQPGSWTTPSALNCWAFLPAPRLSFSDSWEIVRAGKCLSEEEDLAPNHHDWSLDPQHPCQKLGMAM